jgi:hypothetical protein
MKRLTISLLAVAAIAVSSASAQGRAHSRQGFWFNGGLGYGSLGCQDCGSREGGLSGGISLGATINSRVLIGVGTTGWTRSEDGATLTVGTLDARVRFYPSPNGGFYLTAGFGIGSVAASVSGFGSASEMGVGEVLGLGYDFRMGNNVSLTPYWHMYAVQAGESDANVGQLGLSITVH